MCLWQKHGSQFWYLIDISSGLCLLTLSKSLYISVSTVMGHGLIQTTVIYHPHDSTHWSPACMYHVFSLGWSLWNSTNSYSVTSLPICLECTWMKFTNTTHQASSNNTREDSTHGHHQMVNTEIRLIIFSAAKDGEPLYSQQKQDQELTVAQIMNSLLPNSDWNWRK